MARISRRVFLKLAAGGATVAAAGLGAKYACEVLYAKETQPMKYANTLKPIADAPPILADFPQYVEPMQQEPRFLAEPLVNDGGGDLIVRSWRYWYNARGIVEMENRLQAAATAVVMVHPWGIDDGHGLATPEPAGVAFFCQKDKNQTARAHMRDVVKPFLRRLRGRAAVVSYSLPGTEDPIRKLLYASINTKPSQLDIAQGEKQLAAALGAHKFTGGPLARDLELGDANPVNAYFAATPSTDAGDRYNGAGFWQLPMPLAADLEHESTDIVFYDGEGYAKVRDYLKGLGVRHVLLLGYCTDMCVISTTCGYNNLSKDFDLFLVGDATLATYPGSTTPRFATQVALANASLSQMITQVNWVKLTK